MPCDTCHVLVFRCCCTSRLVYAIRVYAAVAVINNLLLRPPAQGANARPCNADRRTGTGIICDARFRHGPLPIVSLTDCTVSVTIRSTE